jgi:hypothetical protein
VQFAGQATSTQYSCNSGLSNTVVNGLKLTFVHAN